MHLFVRTTKYRVEPAVRKVAEEEQCSLELFRKPAVVVPKNDWLVDYQRKERRNANASPGKINPRVCERKTPVSVAISHAEKQFVSEEISQPAGLKLLQSGDSNVDNQRKNDHVESKRKNALRQNEATHAA